MQPEILRSELTYHSIGRKAKSAPLKKFSNYHFVVKTGTFLLLGSHLLLNDAWFIFTVHQHYLSEYKVNSAYSEPTGVNCTAPDRL